jgi:hypothetical protein
VHGQGGTPHTHPVITAPGQGEPRSAHWEASFNANADAGQLTAPGDSPAPSRLPPWQLGDIADSHQRQQSAIDARCLPTSCEAVPAATASLAQQQQLLEQQSWWRGCGHTGLLPLALPLGPAPALHHQWRQYQAAAPLPGLALRTALPAQPAHQASLQQGCLEPGLSSGELSCLAAQHSGGVRCVVPWWAAPLPACTAQQEVCQCGAPCLCMR